MKKLARRQFLKISGAAASSGLLPKGQIASVLEALAAPVTVVAETTASVTPVVLAALSSAAEAFEALFDEYNPFKTFFDYDFQPATSDKFFAALEGDIEKFFRKASVLAGHMRVLQDHSEVATRVLTPAWKELDEWDAWNYVADRRLLGNSLVQWIDDPSISADTKMANLEKYYASRGPTPFSSDLVNWEKQPAEVFATIKEKIFEIHSRLEGKKPQDAVALIDKQEENFFRGIRSYIYEQFENVFDPFYQEADDRFTELAEQYGLSKDAIWYFRIERDFALPWRIDSDRTGIRLKLDEAPDRILSKVQKAARGIPDSYQRMKQHWWLKESPNRAMFDEVCQRLPGFVAEIVPRMTQLHFPEDVIKAAEEQTARESAKTEQQEAIESPQNHQSLQAAETSPRRSPLAVREQLLNQEFGNRIWTDRHKGVLPARLVTLHP